MSNLAGIIASTLRPWPVTAPAITLSATFPSSLHVGDTGSFVVTATEADGATGTLTITASGLPDGMTLGATTDNGDGTFSATVSYDLTTVQDVTTTFSATGGSVAAEPLTHEFNVQAVSTATPSLVQSRSATAFGASASKAFTPTPTAGHLLVAQLAISRSSTVATPPAGFTLLGSTTSDNSPDIYVYSKISDGTEASVSATQSLASNIGLVIFEWQDASSISGLVARDLGTMGAEVTQITLGPTSGPPNANSIPVACYALTDQQDTPVHGAGWTMDIPGKQAYSTGTAHMATPPGAAVSDVVTISIPGTESGDSATYWVNP